MADMDDSYTPIPISNTTTTTSSDSTSIPTSFTSSTTSSFSFGTASTSHAQRPHLNSTTSTSTSSTSAFPDFNFSSTSPSPSPSPSISLPSFTSPQPQAHKRTSEAVNGDVIDDDEDDDERGHASKRKYQREEQDDDQDREEEEKGAMNDSSGPDDSFMDLLNIFSKLNFPEGQPEPCPLCPLTFPIKEFAAHVYKCIKQLDEVDREQQERADAQLAYKIATEVGAEEDQFFYTRNASTDEDMSTTTQRRKCKDGIRCKRVDARHFIDIEHPPVSCPICEQQYPVYELDAHITICLTQPQQPKPAFSQSSGTSFSAIAGDTNMDGSNSNTNINNAFSSSAFTSIRDDIAQPSPSPPLPAKIVFGEDFNDDDDRDDSKDTPIRRSASAGANIGRHQLTLEQAAAMASLVVDQQSKSAANQDYSLVDLLDTFKTLGFTQENLTNLSKTIDTNKQTTSSATSPPPTTSSSQPTSSNTT